MTRNRRQRDPDRLPLVKLFYRSGKYAGSFTGIREKGFLVLDYDR